MTDINFGSVLTRLWPNGDEKIPGLRAGMIETAGGVFQRYGITSPLLIAHVMAQISHECGAGHEVVEDLSYRAERIPEVWPSRFPNIASAQPYAHNPRALANKVYNGRMGNATGSDDGFNFRGRGASQTTGREGYQRLAKAAGLDVVNHPDLVNDPKHFLECGVADFILCGCLPYAKADDVLNVTKRLNGGTVGLDQRRQWLSKWKAALGSGPVTFAPTGTAKAPTAILPLGPTPPDVPPRAATRPDPVPQVTLAKPATPTAAKVGGGAVVIAAPVIAASAGYGWLEIGLSAFIAAGLVTAVVLLIRKFRS
jgi:putative chitinase